MKAGGAIGIGPRRSARTTTAALGSGKKIRGPRHGPRRPDLVVLDVVENDEQVRSPDRRDKLERWIDNAVMKSGAADGSLKCLFVGPSSTSTRRSRARPGSLAGA